MGRVDKVRIQRRLNRLKNIERAEDQRNRKPRRKDIPTLKELAGHAQINQVSMWRYSVALKKMMREKG